MHRPRPHLALVLLSCAMIAGCGGGGDGGSAAQVGAPPAVAGSAQRSVPGYAVRAERRSPIAAGAPCTVRLAVSPDEGQAPITGVEAWLGGDAYTVPPTTTTAVPVPGTTGTWQVSALLPDPLPADATIWLRLTAADGSVLEIGRDAFRLADLPGG